MNWIKTGLCFLAMAFIVVAQAQPKRVVADKIVGKVGDRIILKSNITNAVIDAKRQGMEVPPNADCVFLESELIKKSLVLQAEKDSLLVSDDEIESKLDLQIRQFVGMYGSVQALEEIAGRSLDQIKDDFRKDFKEREMANKMKDKIVSNVKITPVEVKQYFESIPKDSLAYYETEMEVGQIIVFPKVARDIESYTIKQLNDIRSDIINNNKRFDLMVKLYSEDPGSKDNGGQYTLNKSDKMWDPAFFNTAFKLKEGQISNVVKSKFGYHIIQCVSRAGDDVIVRHILKVPPITKEETDEAIAKLDSVRAKLIAGTIEFGAAVSKYSEDEDKFSGGWMTGSDGSTYLTIDQMDKDVMAQLKDLKPGQYTQPEEFTNQQGKKALRILYLKNKTNPHRENLEEDYDKLSKRALEHKRQTILNSWFDSRIKNYYIYVDPEYAGCPTLGPWFAASVKTN